MAYDVKVADYIAEGICNGCDQDPAKCYNLGYCIYDKIIEENEK
jgi:hypothetical protein